MCTSVADIRVRVCLKLFLSVYQRKYTCADLKSLLVIFGAQRTAGEARVSVGFLERIRKYAVLRMED